MDVLKEVAQQLGLTREYAYNIISEIIPQIFVEESLSKQKLLHTILEKHVEFMKKISESSLQKILILRAASYSNSRSKVYIPTKSFGAGSWIRVFPTPTCPVCDNKNKKEELILAEVFKNYKIRGVYRCHRCGYELFASFEQVAIAEEFTIEASDGKIRWVKNIIESDPRVAWSSSGLQIFCYHLMELFPLSVPDQKFSDEINRLSPSFSRIYNESFKAEKYGFEEVAGGGYRKALEFLIKDFCISLHPSQEEEIKSKPLAKCIEEYVTDFNIKEAAKRAAWLGNDQLHYLRRWTDKDIEDLKKFIAHTVKSIEHHLETLKIINTMPEHKRA